MWLKELEITEIVLASTVGGECFFHENYNNNILVNAMSVGLVKKIKFFIQPQKELEIQLFM